MRPIMMERAASLPPKPRKLHPKRAPHRPNALPLQRYVPGRGFSREREAGQRTLATPTRQRFIRSCNTRRCMPRPPYCILGPPMTAGPNDVWVFRIVHQDTGKPAPGVPVTVLDRAGNAEGHWVSDADGTVAIPRRETLRLRIRVGLRSEDPIELATATLGE